MICLILLNLARHLFWPQNNDADIRAYLPYFCRRSQSKGLPLAIKETKNNENIYQPDLFVVSLVGVHSDEKIELIRGFVGEEIIPHPVTNNGTR